MNRHTIAILVQDRPGVLARIAALFSRRGYNIVSLAVGTTEQPGLSRITVVVEVSDHALEQITKQLNKLIDVIKIIELDPATAIERELILIKVRADDKSRAAVLQLVELFRANVIDVSHDAVTVEATGSLQKVSALISILEPHGIKEIVQSGAIALARGNRSITDRNRN